MHTIHLPAADWLAAEVDDVFSRKFQGDMSNKHRACIYWAKATCFVLQREGFDVQPQAGSASWEINDNPPPTPNAFGYEFHMNEAIGHMARDVLPEMHCWAAIMDTGVIIDCAARFFRR